MFRPLPFAGLLTGKLDQMQLSLKKAHVFTPFFIQTASATPLLPYHY